MYVVKVEIFYKDGLRSICINHREMEGTAILEDKPVEKWFCPIKGRASWKGLQEEIAEQDESGRMEKTYCFIFHGPEELRQQFQKNISDSKMGRMAELSEIEKTAQEYMEIAEQQKAIGDSRGAVQACCIAADWYHLAKAEFLYGNYCENILRDMDAAAEYYGKAARQGCADAQYRYGKCLETGMGVPKNEEEAIIWYRNAAEQGQKDASKELVQRRQALEEERKLEEERRKLEERRNEEEKTRREQELQAQVEAGKRVKSDKRITLAKVEQTAHEIWTSPVSMKDVPRSAKDGVAMIKIGAFAVELGAHVIDIAKGYVATTRALKKIDMSRYEELLDNDNELDESDKAQS